jgi:probable HAF family extracellular repeat protein
MKIYRRESYIVTRAIATGFVALCLTAAPASGQYCTVQDLGSLATSYQQSVATAINNRGEVAGWTSIRADRHAFLFEDGVMKDLGTLASNGPGYSTGYSTAYGINNRGQVVGISELGAGGGYHAFLFDTDKMIDLGTLSINPRNHNSRANAINDRGQVVGSSETDAMQTHAFLYENGTMTDLGTLPGDVNSTALGINNSGQVVGNSDDGRTSHAFLYEKGTMIDLGKLAGAPFSFATGINERGQVVGNLPGNPFLFDKGAMVNLAAGSGLNGLAQAINNRGDAVGYQSPSGKSLFFRKGEVIDISKTPTATFLVAQAINDSGQVAGIIEVPSLGTTGYHAAICTPVK